jgi:hypothetical protein
VIASVPATLEYVAAITAAPLPTPVTTPVPDTVAADVFDDDHVARLVTSCVLPVDRVAVAVNCDAVPTAGALPVTLTEVTELAAVVESPHAAANPANAITNIRMIADRILITVSLAALALSCLAVTGVQTAGLSQKCGQDVKSPRPRRAVRKPQVAAEYLPQVDRRRRPSGRYAETCHGTA